MITNQCIQENMTLDEKLMQFEAIVHTVMEFIDKQGGVHSVALVAAADIDGGVYTVSSGTMCKEVFNVACKAHFSGKGEQIHECSRPC